MVPSSVPHAVRVSESEDTQIQNQLVVLGGAGVGKSSLAIQFAMGFFTDYLTFLEDPYYQRTCLIDNKFCLMEIFDPTTGREEFNAAMLRQDMRVAQGFVLVYSITSRESFEEIVTAYQQILRFKKKGGFSAILVGNKCDLEHKREVGVHEGRELAGYLGCGFIETSAKRCIKLDEAFFDLIREIRKRESASWAMYNQLGGSDDRSRDHRGGCVVV